MEEPTLRFALLCLAVTLSGAAALTYELIWIRRLGEIFGQTVYAINIVLAVIFGGLGLGAYLFGRVADRMAGRISLFCVLELCIGLCGLLFLPLSGLVERLYLSLGPAEWSVGPALWVKGAFTALLLALPAVAMGGTLSALTRHVVRRDRDLAPRLGWLYGLNTLGAAAGVAGTSFLWLPRLGLPGTMVLAAAGNATAALLGFCFRLKGDPAPLHAPEPAAASPSDPVRTTYVIVAAAALAGFVGAGFEILWTRALSSRFLSTTYSFSVILLVFLAAMGLGSIVVALLDRVGLARRAMCALLFGAAGLAGAFSILQLSAVPAANQQAVEGFAAYQWSELRHALWVIGAPVFLLGCTFPLLVRLGHRRVDHVGREVGRVYLANTCGSVVSPLLFGFLLLPALGLKTLLLLTSWSCVLFAALFLVPWAFRRRVWSVVTASLLLASMTALWTRVPEDIRFWTDTETERLVAYREGLAASVSVVLVPPGNLVLKINNSYRLGDTRRVFAQARQGLIPLLLHPRPRRMLFLGVGTGGSAGAAAAPGGVDIAALEILPDWQDVLHHFLESNFGFVERVHLEEGVRFLAVDARHLVQATER
ncbi:MAG: hypothetical protein O7C98_15590, partial [Planctomycetota bacterium]|nr:hypothetical protein [Planctomycetota bacterium]